MLSRQWQYELRRKFSLDFQVIDADSTFQLRRRMGIDTNPWKAFPRVITSMDYLRQPDVLQQFLQASGAGPDAESDPRSASAHAAWDLLIADEVHHFAPQGGNRASQRTRMLREIRFLFEHRLFCSATPHNGRTVSFTGLLELLDPIRFQMTAEMDEQDKKNLREVRVRRLKDDINRQSLKPPFADQKEPVALPVKLSPQEVELYAAVRDYRKYGQAALDRASAQERWLGQFVNALLTKRLLSCPFAFARTWWRHIEEEAPEETGTLFDMARVSAERAEEQVRSDDERSTLEEDTARYSGAWLRTSGKGLDGPQRRVNAALEKLGYDRKQVEDAGKVADLARRSDSKTDALVGWIKKNLFQAGKLRDDERLIVFTEYKETLFYLEQRLLQEGFDKNTLRLLYGGMTADEFESVKGEFEDPAAPVRLLLATDAASEGINMQESCRFILHYDIPWSPSRLQQRNGRVSRHGQVRDVYVHYFRSNEDEDMEFLYQVAQKVEQVRQDLGSVERIFDAAIQQHFQGKATPVRQVGLIVDQQLAASPERQELGQSGDDEIAAASHRARELLEGTETRLGISPDALIDLMRAALAVEGQGSLEEIAGRPGFFRLKPPPRWEGLARQTMTVGTRTDRMEVVFDARRITEEIGGREVMRLKKHQILMRLGHPVMRQAMSTLTRQLHDATSHDPVYRWSVAALPKTGFEALVVFYHTVTAVNELREPLHDEVLTAVFRVGGDKLVPVEESFGREVTRAEFLPVKSAARRDDWVRIFRGRWFKHRGELESYRSGREEALFASLQKQADVVRDRDVEATKEGYKYRLRELQDRSREQELTKLARELIRQRAEAAQPTLFDEVNLETRERLGEIEDQMAVLKQDVERTRELLTRERDRRLKVVLPRRYKLRKPNVLPLALVYLIPATPEDARP
jgi:superfamily II DNA or RNA helicase